jgi:hypothetical protein
LRGGFGTQAAAAKTLLRLRSVAPQLVGATTPAIVSTMMARLGLHGNEEAAAIDVLGGVGRPAVDELVKLARTNYLSLDEAGKRMWGSAVYTLVQIAQVNRQAVQPLLQALREKDYSFIHDFHMFYVQLGLGEQTLIETLNARGDTGIVLSFITSGNPRLDAAAREYARTHGYTITGKNTLPATWAQAKLAR